MTYQIDILNSKATKLLQNLADLDLIAIRKIKEEDGFLKAVRQLRKKASPTAPSIEEITREVELARTKRYAEKKR